MRPEVQKLVACPPPTDTLCLWQWSRSPLACGAGDVFGRAARTDGASGRLSLMIVAAPLTPRVSLAEELLLLRVMYNNWAFDASGRAG